jgi:hypothetical protein
MRVFFVEGMKIDFKFIGFYLSRERFFADFIFLFEFWALLIKYS